MDLGDQAHTELVRYQSGTWTSIALPVINGSAVFPAPPAIVSLTAVPGTDVTWVPIVYQDAMTSQFHYSIYEYVR
jgi:hypothetical protein